MSVQDFIVQIMNEAVLITIVISMPTIVVSLLLGLLFPFSDAVRIKLDLPLVFLVCSTPLLFFCTEPHICGRKRKLYCWHCKAGCLHSDPATVSHPAADVCLQPPSFHATCSVVPLFPMLAGVLGSSEQKRGCSAGHAHGVTWSGRNVLYTTPLKRKD